MGKVVQITIQTLNGDGSYGIYVTCDMQIQLSTAVEFVCRWDMQIQLIHIVCMIIDGTIQFDLSIEYGFNTKEGRKVLWQDLIRIGFPITRHWLMMGDLSSVRFHHEKIGGKTPSEVNNLIQLLHLNYWTAISPGDGLDLIILLV